jgi:hypothetical protein
VRALTLTRPWPWAIFHAPMAIAKRIENRTWKPWECVRGERIAIHAGQAFDDDADALISGNAFITTPRPDHWYDGGIIGTARVEGWHEQVAGKMLTTFIDGSSTYDDFPLEQRRWWIGPYAWILGGVITFHKPVDPGRGFHRGLWQLDAITLASVRASEALKGSGL